MDDQQPLVSIDVVPIRFAGATTGVQVGLSHRIFEPYLDRLALPGVLLHAGESIEEAAIRALQSKNGLAAGHLLHVGAFDSSNRDPRGASISIALLSVQNSGAEDEKTTWFSLDAVPELPFDHNFIVATAVARLEQALWNDVELTRSVLGDYFTTADAVALKSPTPHTSNASRWLKAWGYLEKGEGKSTGGGPGRPAGAWSWID